jgi:hypothetical protein
MTRDSVIDALRMAWFKRHPGKSAGLIFHSDRGSQYASKDFRDMLTEYGITASMSRRGNCWDNACSETLFGSLKVERLHGQRFNSRRQAKDEIIAWLLWYNRTRLHSTLAYVSPMRFEENWRADKPGKPAHEPDYGIRIPGARSKTDSLEGEKWEPPWRRLRSRWPNAQYSGSLCSRLFSILPSLGIQGGVQPRQQQWG